MNFLTLITQLLPIASGFIPGGAQVTLLATAAANIIAYIQAQKGLTTDQILDRAGVQLDANEVELLKDLARLQGSGRSAPSRGRGAASGRAAASKGGASRSSGSASKAAKGGGASRSGSVAGRASSKKGASKKSGRRS